MSGIKIKVLSPAGHDEIVISEPEKALDILREYERRGYWIALCGSCEAPKVVASSELTVEDLKKANEVLLVTELVGG